MLQKNPKRRISATEALNHAFFSEEILEKGDFKNDYCVFHELSGLFLNEK